jgi:hypothetical protein
VDFTFNGYSIADFGLTATSESSLHPAEPNITWHEPAYGTPVDTSRFVTGDMTYNLVDDEYAEFYVPQEVTIDGETKTREDMWQWFMANVHGQVVDMTCEARKSGTELLHWYADCTVTDESGLPCKHEIIKVSWQRTPWLDLADGTYTHSEPAQWALSDTFVAESAYELEDTGATWKMSSIGWNYSMVEERPSQIDTTNTIRVGFVYPFKWRSTQEVFYECYTFSFKVTSENAFFVVQAWKDTNDKVIDNIVKTNYATDVTDLVYGGYETCAASQASSMSEAISYFEDLLAFNCYSVIDMPYILDDTSASYGYGYGWRVWGKTYANYYPYGYSSFDYTGYYELTETDGVFTLNDATMLKSHTWNAGYIYQSSDLQQVPQLFLSKAGTDAKITWTSGLYGSFANLEHTWSFTRDSSLQSQLVVDVNYPCTLTHDSWSETLAKGTQALTSSCTNGDYLFSFPYLDDNFTEIDEDEYTGQDVYIDGYSLPAGYSAKPSDWTDGATITDAYINMYWVEDGTISILGSDIVTFPTWSAGHLLADGEGYIKLDNWAGDWIDGLSIKEDTIKIEVSWERGEL